MVRRTTVTLDENDQKAVQDLAEVSRPEHEVLCDFARSHGVQLSGTASDATVIRVLVLAGIEYIRHTALEASYDRIAALWNNPDAEEKAERAALRAHYADRSDRRMPA